MQLLSFLRGNNLACLSNISIRENCTVCEAISTVSGSLLSPIHLEPLNLTASSPEMIPKSLIEYMYFMPSGWVIVVMLGYFLFTEILCSPLLMIIVYSPPSSILSLRCWAHFYTICCHFKKITVTFSSLLLVLWYSKLLLHCAKIWRYTAKNP